MLFIAFKKLRFGKRLRLFLPVGELSGWAGKGCSPGCDALQHHPGSDTGPGAPLGCGEWFLQDMRPGGCRDGGGLYRRDGLDWCPGMVVTGAQGWQWPIQGMGLLVPKDGGGWYQGMVIIGAKGWGDLHPGVAVADIRDGGCWYPRIEVAGNREIFVTGAQGWRWLVRRDGGGSCQWWRLLVLRDELTGTQGWQ